MKKKVSAIVMIAILMLALAACSNQNSDEAVNISNDDELVAFDKGANRIKKEVKANELNLADNEIALYWGDNVFWIVRCCDNYEESIISPIQVDNPAKFQYFVIKRQKEMVKKWAYCKPETLSKEWLELQYDHVGEKYQVAFPYYALIDWNEKTTYRFEKPGTKNKYHYLTFKAYNEYNS